MRAQESVSPFINAAADNSDTFDLGGGAYFVLSKSTGAGTINLRVLSIDGVTWLPCGLTQITGVTGFQSLPLPPGRYRVEITGFTANYVSVTRVPGD